MERKVKRINIQDLDGWTKPHVITFSAFHIGHSYGPIGLTRPALPIGVPHKYKETKQHKTFYDG